MLTSAERFWDRLATLPVGEGEACNKILDGSRKYLGPEEVVLDFGCGPGAITNQLAGHVREVVGVDTSPKMVAAAELAAAEQGIDNVSYSTSSIFDPEHHQGRFSVITAFNVLHYVEDMPALMQRIRSLLQPGGVFISSTACLAEKPAWIRGAFRASSGLRLMPRMTFFDGLELQHSFEAQGFRIEEAQTISPTFADLFVVSR